MRKAQVLEVRDIEGCTPLVYAACRGREDVVKLLLDRGADVASEDNSRNTVLMHAVTSRNAAVAALILDAAAHVCGKQKSQLLNRQNARGCWAMNFAVLEDNCQMLKLLSDNDADTQLQNGSGLSSLHAAAKYGRQRMIRWLVEQQSMSLQVAKRDSLFGFFLTKQ